MALTPDFAEFEAGWAEGRNQLVYARLAADLDTPVSVMLKLTDAGRDAFILESVTGGEVRGRYSIIGMKPDLIWECRGADSRVNRTARYDRERSSPARPPAGGAARALVRKSAIDMPADLPAAAAGLFGYLGYDMIRLVEHLPDVNPDPLGLPDAVLMRPSVIAVLDGVKGEVTVVAPAWVGSASRRGRPMRRRPNGCRTRCATWNARPRRRREMGDAAPLGEPVSNFAHADYLRRWRRPRTTSARATSSRSCRRSAGASTSRSRPSRSTGH
jgi:anthranilate synthase component 1